MKRIKVPKSSYHGCSGRKYVFSCRQLTKELLGVHSCDLFPKSVSGPILQLFPKYPFPIKKPCQSNQYQEQSKCGKHRYNANKRKTNKGYYQDNWGNIRPFLRFGSIRLTVSTMIFRLQSSNASVRVFANIEYVENTRSQPLQKREPNLQQSNGTKQAATL